MARRIAESELEKRRQRRVMFFGIFMIVIMVFSTFAYYISSAPTGDGQLEYGEYEFIFDQGANGGFGAWVTDIDKQQVEFQNLPLQVASLPVDQQAVALLQNAGQVALSSHTNLSFENASTIDYARLQLGLAIPKAFNAMAADDERYTLPVFDCADATPQLPVVLFAVSNKTQVTTEGSCIIVEGQGRGLVNLKDRLIFEYYVILQNGVVNE